MLYDVITQGFYRGWQPNVTRAAIVNIGELATYDEAKRAIKEATQWEEGVVLHTSSALCSGFVAALLSTPADVCKSRVMSGMYVRHRDDVIEHGAVLEYAVVTSRHG